jgi:hypothetical protein
MARYFFHLRTGDGTEITDEYGDELPDAKAAEEHATASVRDLLKGSPLDWGRASFEVYDEGGSHVVTVWFRETAAAPGPRGHRSPPDDQHA